MVFVEQKDGLDVEGFRKAVLAQVNKDFPEWSKLHRADPRSEVSSGRSWRCFADPNGGALGQLRAARRAGGHAAGADHMRGVFNVPLAGAEELASTS